MAIVINGSGTVTGISVGGLPDGTVDAGTLATDSVVTGKIADGTIANADIADLAASKLTGALPAISGASLTGFTDAQMPTGSVLQVVETTYGTEVSTGSSSYVDTGLSASITPTSTSSKILVTAGLTAMVYNNSSADAQAHFQMLRASTQISTKLLRLYDYGNSGTMLVVPTYFCKLDSPSTTSAVTYKIQMLIDTGGGVRAHFDDFKSNMVLMEIAG